MQNPMTRPTVSVVIPCHNYARYLPEAVESVRRQTCMAHELVVVDDASDDDTLEACIRLGVQYVRIEARDPWEARRVGYEATSGDVLLFLDADDFIADDYIDRGLHTLCTDWRIGIAYSDMQRFGERNDKTRFPPYLDPDALNRENFLHAGSMVRRSALRVSDAFSQPPPDRDTCHEDWWLWRRVIEHGYHAVKQSGIYYYRRHGESSMLDHRNQSHYVDRAGFTAEPVTILIPLAGRYDAWSHMRDWLDNQTWSNVHLVLADTSQDEAYGAMVREWIAGCRYDDVRYMRFAAGPKGLADQPRAERVYQVQDVVCRIWARMTRSLETPWTLTLEDDTIPQLDAIEQLLRSIAGPKVDAAVAPYLSRHGGEYVVFRRRRTVPVGQEGHGIERVHGAGWGCMLIRSSVLRGHVVAPGPGPADWYDPWLVRGTGIKMVCNWDVKCRHLAAESSTVVPPGVEGPGEEHREAHSEHSEPRHDDTLDVANAR